MLKIRNSINFVGDSLFCEWAYVIDFDKNTFEVYEGFNQNPLESTERFYSYYNKEQEHAHEDIYYPCRLIASFDLNNLPNKEDFLNICEPKEKVMEILMADTCICCGGDVFEVNGEHFCHNINCPLFMKPQEWFKKHECHLCKKANICKENNGAYCIRLAIKKDEEN